MEGVHCVAGPWFTVHRSGDDWQTLDTIWISNGVKTDKATVQSKVVFDDAGNHDHLSTELSHATR